MIEKTLESRLEHVEQTENSITNFWNRLEDEITGPADDVHASYWEHLEQNILTDKADVNFQVERFLPKNGGDWEDIPGDSNWQPDINIIPGDRHGTNRNHKTWGEIMDNYHFKEIPFHDGEPDFSEVAKDEVTIDDFTDDRSSNFVQADEALAQKYDCKPETIEQWRKENKYTWHEKSDCQTLQLVPTEVHGNIPHSGGVSKYKAQSIYV